LAAPMAGGLTLPSDLARSPDAAIEICAADADHDPEEWGALDPYGYVTVEGMWRQEGDPVDEGEPLFDLSDPSGELPVRSPVDGTLVRVCVRPYQKVRLDDVLAIVEPSDHSTLGIRQPPPPSDVEISIYVCRSCGKGNRAPRRLPIDAIRCGACGGALEFSDSRHTPERRPSVLGRMAGQIRKRTAQIASMTARGLHWFSVIPTTRLRSSQVGAIVGAMLGIAVAALSDGALMERVPRSMVLAGLLGVGVAGMTEAGVALMTYTRQKRHALRHVSGVLLIIVGSGLTMAGLVESDGLAAGLGVMLMVAGLFLGGWIPPRPRVTRA